MIRITARARKGAAPRKLAGAVEQVVSSGELSESAVEALRCGAAAAQKLIYRAGRGDDVSIQLGLADDPLGGWSISLLVNVDPRPARR